MGKEVWYGIFSDWIKSYNSINHLENEAILDDEETITARDKLLNDIIETITGEINDE